MPSTTTSSSAQAPLATQTQTEKPIHYTYLKEFRVDQCPLFLQHKCTQHKPFTCFYWHFMNQRRRRPVRKRDGTFNYSPDVYCTKYDETTGLCPEGEECPYLHRTAGDTERRYHLRYYKTGVCVYDTDTRGYCVKNGPHCAFAHGIHDLRNPVYDVREIQGLDCAGAGTSLGLAGGVSGILGLGDDSLAGANGSSIGPNSLDKERNALNEDPKWQDTNYVLANYKTEPCKRPPRLCRQGYACPQFHNSRDRRRSPKKYKYRSTPCPNVKQSDEWGDPANCDNGDNCPYCHTRTEQQFHPEIYKSTKCNDIQQTGYCPRGPFCAFAHVDKEMSAIRDINLENSNSLAAILSSALPSSNSSSSQSHHSQPLSASLDCGQYMMHGPVGRPRSYSTSANLSHSTEPLLLQYHKAPGSEREDKESNIRRQFHMLDNDSSLNSLEKSCLSQTVYLSHGLGLNSSAMNSFSSNYYPASDTVESVVGNALDDLSLDDINIEASIDKDLENDVGPLTNSLPSLGGSSLLGSSAPVTIPGSTLHNSTGLSPPLGSPLGSLGHSLGLGGVLGGHRGSIGSRADTNCTLDKAAAAFYGHPNSFGNPPNSSSLSQYAPFSPTVYELPQNLSPTNRVGGAVGPVGAPSAVGSLGSLNSNSMGRSGNSLSEVRRLRDELAVSRAQIASWEEGIVHARTACEAWKREAEEANWREHLAEQQRDQALAKMSNFRKGVNNFGNPSGSVAPPVLTTGSSPFLFGVGPVVGTDLENLPLSHLKQIQEQLRSDLDKVDQALVHQCGSKCLICQETSKGVTLLPCKHTAVVCSDCVPSLKQCPSCNCLLSEWNDSASSSNFVIGNNENENSTTSLGTL